MSLADCSAGRFQERWALLSTILGSSMAFVDGTVVNVAIPTLQRNLGASLAEVQWVVEVYILFLTALLLLGGAVGDRYGRRRVFMLGVVLFSAASLLCGLAPNVNWLIAARGLQGVAGALLIPGSLALLSGSVEPIRRGRAIGIWSSFSAMTTGLGLVLGGWLIDTAGWRWVFYINLLIGAVALLCCWWGVAEQRTAESKPLDKIGALLITLSLSGLVFGVVEISRLGSDHPAVVVALLLGTLLLVGFWLWERYTPYPMVPPELFRSTTFTGVNLLTFFLYAALMVMFFFVPMNLIHVHGYSAFAAGAANIPFVVLMALLSRRAGLLTDRCGPRPLLIGGPLLTALGYGWLAWGAGGAYWQGFFPGILLLGLGMAASVAPLTTTVMTAVPAGYTGVAAGINNAIARGAGLISIAASGPIILAVFSSRLEERLRAGGVSDVVIGRFRPLWIDLGATTPPPGLSPALAVQLAAAVDAAFVDGFRLLMLGLVGLAVAASAMAYRYIHPADLPTSAPSIAPANEP